MTLIKSGFEVANKSSELPSPIRNSGKLEQYFTQLENAYFNIEPFLTENRKQLLWEKQQEFQGLLWSIYKQGENQKTDEQINKYLEFTHFFRDELNIGLFNESVNLK